MPRHPETPLIVRARGFLQAGPAESCSLVAAVCQLPGVPGTVADHLAETLLGARPEFMRLADGRWALAATDQAGTMPAAPGSASLECLEGPQDDRTLASMSFVVVDVETTGGRPLGGDRMTEFAAVVVRDGAIAETFETLLNPERSIPPWITRLTNISWDMVRDAPRFRDVAADVTRLLDGHVFVAHNARFDWGFVSMELARATGETLTAPQLCTVRLARRLLPHLRRRSLDYVADHYAVGIAARHRAMGDALATAHVLRGLLRDAEGRGCFTWGDLQRLLAAPAARRRSRRSALPMPVIRDTTA